MSYLNGALSNRVESERNPVQSVENWPGGKTFQSGEIPLELKSSCDSWTELCFIGCIFERNPAQSCYIWTEPCPIVLYLNGTLSNRVESERNPVQSVENWPDGKTSQSGEIPLELPGCPVSPASEYYRYIRLISEFPAWNSGFVFEYLHNDWVSISEYWPYFQYAAVSYPIILYHTPYFQISNIGFISESPFHDPNPQFSRLMWFRFPNFSFPWQLRIVILAEYWPYF